MKTKKSKVRRIVNINKIIRDPGKISRGLQLEFEVSREIRIPRGSFKPFS